MKKIAPIFLFTVLLSLISCEEVINVDLDTAPAKLVIDASIDWEKGTPGTTQIIKLTTTTGYYSNVVPSVSGATIFITSGSDVFNFNEEVPNSGLYVCTTFVPIIGETYTLTVIHAGETYEASEKMIPVPSIIETNTSQRDDAGFGLNEIEVKFFFQDDGQENNSYLTKSTTPINALPEYFAFDDRYAQGNEMFGLYTNKDLKPGDAIEFCLYGISKQYFNYMRILLANAGTSNGNPFQTPPATVRGNIINQTNESNYCLGYFRLSEVDKFQYIVQ